MSRLVSPRLAPAGAAPEYFPAHMRVLVDWIGGCIQCLVIESTVHVQSTNV